MTEISQTAIACAVSAASATIEQARARIAEIGRPQTEALAQDIRDFLTCSALVAFLEMLPSDATALDISDAMVIYTGARALKTASDILDHR
jgi:hypothetical protein